jgi:glycosyltransferase involved in cell wall biosynthesis
MEQRIKEYNLKKQFAITGFKNQTEIPEYFVASDVFILPSTIGETWGLVSNEAMNFNLPLLSSDLPGSAYDLVKDGINGFVYPCGDIKALAEKMSWFIDNHIKIPTMGQESGRIIEDYSYVAFISAINKIVLNK